LSRVPTAAMEPAAVSAVQFRARIEAAVANMPGAPARLGRGAPSAPNTVLQSVGPVRLGRMRHLILVWLLATTAAALPACDHITVGPVQPSCDICGGHGAR
jgi:hypothetical protein